MKHIIISVLIAVPVTLIIIGGIAAALMFEMYYLHKNAPTTQPTQQSISRPATPQESQSQQPSQQPKRKSSVENLSTDITKPAKLVDVAITDKQQIDKLNQEIDAMKLEIINLSKHKISTGNQQARVTISEAPQAKPVIKEISHATITESYATSYEPPRTFKPTVQPAPPIRQVHATQATQQPTIQYYQPRSYRRFRFRW